MSGSAGTPDEPQTANEVSSSSTVVPRNVSGSGSLFPPVGGNIARTGGTASRPVSGSSSFSVGGGSARAGMTAGGESAGFVAPRVSSGEQQVIPSAAAAAAVGGSGRLPAVPNASGLTVPPPGGVTAAAQPGNLPDIFCSVGSGRLTGASNADPFGSQTGGERGE